MSTITEAEVEYLRAFVDRMQSLGFIATNKGLLKKSSHWGEPLHHLRHTQIFTTCGEWRVNGIGIAQPQTIEDVDTLVRLVFGESN